LIDDFDDQEILREFRSRFLTILKEEYWHLFHHNRCMSRSVLLLKEWTDMDLDTADTPIDDWKHLKNYVDSKYHMRVLLPLNDISCLKSMVEPFVYGHVSLGYDLVVTYIEAHAKARGALRALTNEDSEHLDIVVQESYKN